MTVLFCSSAWAQTAKIGFVDIQRILAESQAGKKASDRFQAQIKKAEAEIQKERQDLEKLRADLEKKAPLLKEEERRNLEADFQRRSVSLQRNLSDQQQDLQRKRDELMSDILKDVEQVINEVGKAEKFTLIMERRLILYSDQAVDITNKVIEAYNQRAKK
jgi:outer membrane protein